MRRLSIFALGMFMALTSAFAQKGLHSEFQYVSLGPVAGFGHSWISGLSDQAFKPSAHLGISMIYSRYEHWGIGADLIVSHEGYRVEDPVYDHSVNPVYLRLTPRAYYFFGAYGDRIRPKIFAGPSIGYKLDERMINDSEFVGEQQAVSYHGAVFSDFDFGLNAGTGVNVQLVKGTWLNLDASYYHGLTSATGNGGSNRNFRVTAGVLFGL